MTRHLFALLGLLVSSAVFAASPNPPADLRGDWSPLSKTARLELPAIDAAKARADDVSAFKDGQPLQYAVSHEISKAGIAASLDRGEWSQLSNGDWLWRLEVSAPGAVSIDVGFSQFRLPSGAALWLIGEGKGNATKAFTDADNAISGQLWTPIVYGDSARIELRVPANKREFVKLQLGHVQQAYRDILAADVFSSAKSGSCNVDVACPDGDNWRNQINSVARYSFTGFLCSGQLIATTDSGQDQNNPVFSTAHHCISSNDEAATMTLYWKFESPTCRAPGSTESGTSINPNVSVATQSGATFLASDEDADFSLVRLNSAVPTMAEAFWDGWDRRMDLLPGGGVAIHHPAGDAKRISTNVDPLTLGLNCIGGVVWTEPNTHLYVNNWEAGTTEGGSSGSGLYDPATGRLVGVLSNGSASCDVPAGFDCFGRLASAWEGNGGGAASSNMKSWLDPSSTGASFVEGHGICEAPSVTLNSPAFAQPPKAGDTVTLSVDVNGGAGGPYEIRWDLDGDQIYERAGDQAQLNVTYPSAGARQVRVQAVDTSDCVGSTNRALDILAPDVQLTAGSPQQVCGNGDSVIDPGERWFMPFTANNDGNAAFGGGFAMLVPGSVSPAGLPYGPDAFGYAATTSGDGGCGYDFIDIASGEFAVSALAIDGIDDGRTTDAVVLGGSGVNIYGQARSTAVMTTNGYISFDEIETGQDFTNSCPDDIPDRGSVGPRLHVLHDDLVVSDLAGAGVRYRYFASCPRAAENGVGAQPCHVFQWSHLQSYNTADPDEDAEFQAIIYEGSDEIVYQYRTPDNLSGGGASIGMINSTVEGGSLNVHCNAADAAPASSAVCIFAPASNGTSPLVVESPAVSIPSLAVSASVPAAVGFTVAESANCGDTVAIDMAGIADGVSSNVRHNGPLFSVEIGSGGSCNAVTNCPIPTEVPDGSIYGAFSNPVRGGNGLVGYLYPAHAAEGTYGAIWYTGERDNVPTWYTAQGHWANGLAKLDLSRFHNNGTSNALSTTPTAVGQAWLAQPDPNTVVFAWDSADAEIGSGIEILADSGLPYSSPNYSQQWYAPSQSGWGVGNTTWTVSGGFFEYAAMFLYDSSGDARWLVGSTDQLSGSMPMTGFLVHCPGCPRISDQLSRPLSAGTYSRTYTGSDQATIGTAITLPAPMSGSWNRSNVDFRAIAVPEQQ